MKEARKIVFPRLLEARSTSDQLSLVINEKLTLSLSRSSVFSESVIIRRHENKRPIDKMVSGKDLNKHLYHDTDKMASLFIFQGQNIEVKGLLSPTQGIKPLPAPLYRTNTNDIPHVIFDIPESTGGHGNRRKRSPDEEGAQKPSSADTSTRGGTALQISEGAEKPSNKASKGVRYTFYAETYFIFDAALQEIITDPDDAVQYIGAIVSSVNLMLLSIKFPTVKMQICGVEFGSDEVEDVFETLDGRTDLIHDQKALRNFATYVTNEGVYDDYDYVFLFTGKNLADASSETGENVGGIAYVGLPCSQHKVGVVEDDGHFGRISHFAHEFGHALGCPHDGDEAPIYQRNAPGSKRCPWSDGYIMGSRQDPIKKFSYSSCCQRNWNYISKKTTSRCLKENTCSHERELKLPGEIMNVTEFCSSRTELHEESYFDETHSDLSKCKVACRTPADPDGSYSYLTLDALDGTRCGGNDEDNKVCLKGKCTNHRPL